MNWVPQSVNGKLNVTASGDLCWGLQLWLWSDGTLAASRFKGGTVAFLRMVMLKPFLLQKSNLDISGGTYGFGSVERT